MEAWAAEAFCAGWEAWAAEAAEAALACHALPRPPAVGAGVPSAVRRVAVASLHVLGALEQEAWALRGEAEEAVRLHEEEAEEVSEEVLRLRERDLALTERVAATRAESHRLRERDAELARAHVESRMEAMEARARERQLKESSREAELQVDAAAAQAGRAAGPARGERRQPPEPRRSATASRRGAPAQGAGRARGAPEEGARGAGRAVPRGLPMGSA
ncbi:unnamed protein product [Prorocentrum cordatum]|uniref:Uncharacterized protein n=1 Tax=Prorocentrum cordatum TaxID=2364126 RepID=A0ABN9TZV7_9DINO|nr:unnamed protein product [Polarella glacialis]